MKFVSKEPIEKGFSSDRKYRVTDENGTSYLLREADIAQKTRKEEEFRVMERLDSLGLAMCRPVKFWWDEKAVYILHSWVDGQDLEEALPGLPQGEQYRLGLEAGRLLRTIHAIPAPPEREPWEVFYRRKAQARVEQYLACPLKYENEDFFLRCVWERLPLTAGRPTVLQHGDFHRGNLMLDRGGRLQVIDFGKWGWGDPWEEFAAITWDARLTPAFARGRVDGYFDGPPPEPFWPLLTLYISRGLLSSLPWVIPFGAEEIQTMRNQAAAVQGWYSVGSDVPNWYRPLGLKRGTVRLEEHDPCWAAMAAGCIGELKGLLGDAAVDIQHIGSTAIGGIHAKPILDIAVGVRSLEAVEKDIPLLERNNIIYRGCAHPGQLLFVKGDFARDTRTHHIHVAAHGGEEWKNDLNFRDFLNACPEKAAEYGRLKQELAEKHKNDRAAYTAGKGELVTRLLTEARQWRKENPNET